MDIHIDDCMFTGILLLVPLLRSCSHPVEQQQQPRPLPLWLRTSRFIINVLSLSAIFCVVFLWVLLLMLKAQLT